MNDDISRRRFLALTAASAALASGVSCRRSADGEKVVPYTRKPAEIVPGVAVYYASAMQECDNAYGVLVKTREGRPIHIEGNTEDPMHGGRASGRAIADLIGLYDPDRLKAPLSAGRATSMKDGLGELARVIGASARSNKAVLLMTPAVISPSRRALIARFSAAIGHVVHLEWEPAADHAARDVARDVFGVSAIPLLHLDRADVVLSLGADFLGATGDTTAAAHAFSSRRRPQPNGAGMSRLYVIEGAMSLTGSNADRRLAARPSALGPVGFAIAKALLAKGRSLPPGVPAAALDGHDLDRVASAHGLDAEALAGIVDDLDRAGPRALVVAGHSAPEHAHAASHLVGAMLGSPGEVVDLFASPRLASPGDLDAVVSDMAKGAFGAAVFWDVNPAYDSPDPQALRAALGAVPGTVRIGTHQDETSEMCKLVLASHHWLESWGDFDAPGSSALLLAQPTTGPRCDTLQGEDALLGLLAGLGSPGPRTYYEFIRERWRREVYPQASPVPFDRFFAACLHDGGMRKAPAALPMRISPAAIVTGLEAALAANGGGIEIVLTPDPKLFDGRYANNGWLQELPDPVTKTCWDNPVSLSVSDASRLGVENGDVVQIAAGRAGLARPVLVQQGQPPGVLSLALGYGRRTGSVATGIGANAWPLLEGRRGGLVRRLDSLVRAGRSEPLARSQDHFKTSGRDIARITAAGELGARTEPHLASLYPDEPATGLRWGMAIDLSACTGCGACVLACQSENNVPVVGAEQVQKGRAMHWIRIDRYVDGGPLASRAVHVPILCQQCGNAPCENVCPVQATNHSPDGLNQMAYNRCVGTRYCGNNCPYKVRRFNFLDFTGNVRRPLDLARNPEVTVRPRGVMEKCTFCVQRIRNAQQVAKREARPLAESEIQPACALACPTRAIVLGNSNDPSSEVSRLAASHRGYRVLEELGTKPSITYLSAVYNPPR
jgi:Fe-S-cluster-containing dehydrogenase component